MHESVTLLPLHPCMVTSHMIYGKPYILLIVAEFHTYRSVPPSVVYPAKPLVLCSPYLRSLWHSKRSVSDLKVCIELECVSFQCECCMNQPSCVYFRITMFCLCCACVVNYSFYEKNHLVFAFGITLRNLGKLVKNCIHFVWHGFFYISANTKLVQLTFTAWKQYMTYRNIKKKNFGNAYHIADTRRLSQAWQVWRDKIQRRQDRDGMQQHALQYWADGLIHKVGYRTKVA